jgi:hypothetical protein
MLFVEDADGQIRQARNILKTKIVKDYLNANPRITRKDLKEDDITLEFINGRTENILNDLLKITQHYQDKSIPNNPGVNQSHLPYLANFYNEGKNPDVIKFYYDKFIQTPSVHRNKEIFKDFRTFETTIDANQKIDTRIKTQDIDDPPIYEDENIKVFYGSDMNRCVKYGQERKYNLCISRPDITNNLFHGYRVNGLTTYFVYFKQENKEPPFIIVDATPNPEKFSYNPIVPQEDYNIDKDDLIKTYPFLKKPMEMGIFKNVPIEGKEKEFYDKFYETSITSLTDFEDVLEFIRFRIPVDRNEWREMEEMLTQEDFEILLKTAIENEYLIPHSIIFDYTKLYERYLVKQKQKADILEKEIRKKVIDGVYYGDIKIERVAVLPNLKDIIVDENFFCNDNELTNLEGAPEYVRGHFNCSRNQLTSLEGSPNNVRGRFDCSYNELTSLEGAPKIVKGSFICNDNKLIDLEGAPESVGRDFYCSVNKLTSLKGAPKIVGGDFICSVNLLTTLQGGPQTVGNSFLCNFNNLTNLEGAPKMQNKYSTTFFCQHNKLTSLKGAPKIPVMNFNCEFNPESFSVPDIIQAMAETEKKEQLKSESFKYFFYNK